MTLPKRVRDRVAVAVAVLGAAAFLGELVLLWPLIVIVKTIIWP